MRITATNTNSSIKSIANRPTIYSVATEESRRIISPYTPSRSTVKDLIIDSGSSTYVTDYKIFVQISGKGNLKIESLDQNVAIIQDNIAKHVSNGTATIRISFQESSVDKILNFATRQSDSISTFVGYDTNSLSKHCSDWVDTRIAGKNFNDHCPLYTTQNHNYAGAYVRNPNFWAADADLTCISPWNSHGAQWMAGALVSPRHIIFCSHYQIGDGRSVRFIKSDNTIVTRTMTSKYTIPNSGVYYPDITIGLLDSDVPAGINFCKILGSNFTNYLPSLSQTYRIPILCLDQNEWGIICDMHYLNRNMSSAWSSVGSDRYNFKKQFISGDSGNPCFIIINNTLVLTNVMTFGGYGCQGASITYNKDLINAAMTALGGGYQLTEIDLSSFTSY